MNWDDIGEDLRWYIGGQLDGDGSVDVRNECPRIRLTKSVTAAHVVVMFRNIFGGCITTRLPNKDNTEASCTWECLGAYVKPLCKNIAEYMHAKQPQFRLAASMPLGKTPLTVTHGNVTTSYDYRKDVAILLGITKSRIGRLLRGQVSAEYGGHLLVNIPNPRQARAAIAERLHEMKHEAHLPVTRTLPDAYFAGFADAEMCIYVHGPSSLSIYIPQKYPAVLAAFASRFGGSVRQTQVGYAYSVCAKARACLMALLPYSREKLNQVRLAIEADEHNWRENKMRLDKMKGVCVRVGRSNVVKTKEELEAVMKAAGM